jgi:endonuclease YncB( thermonuclease family)
VSYVYRHVSVDRIVDGDTLVLSIDLGNKIKWTDSFRMNGIDTPERGQPGSVEARTYLTELLAHGVSRVETFKPDKYGRWLADVYVSVFGGELLVNKELINKGFAVEYFGGTK